MHYRDRKIIVIYDNRVYPRWAELFSHPQHYCKLVRIACCLDQTVPETYEEIITPDAEVDGSIRINTQVHIYIRLTFRWNNARDVFFRVYKKLDWKKCVQNVPKCSYDIMNLSWMLPMAWLLFGTIPSAAIMLTDGGRCQTVSHEGHIA